MKSTSAGEFLKHPMSVTHAKALAVAPKTDGFI
jgi:hypothetical protein